MVNRMSFLMNNDDFLEVEMAFCKFLHEYYPFLNEDEFDNLVYRLNHFLSKILKEYD